MSSQEIVYGNLDAYFLAYYHKLSLLWFLSDLIIYFGLKCCQAMLDLFCLTCHWTLNCVGILMRGEDNMMGKKFMISHQFPNAVGKFPIVVGNRWEISHLGGKSVGNFPSRWEIGGKSVGNFPSRWEIIKKFPTFFWNFCFIGRLNQKT